MFYFPSPVTYLEFRYIQSVASGALLRIWYSSQNLDAIIECQVEISFPYFSFQIHVIDLFLQFCGCRFQLSITVLISTVLLTKLYVEDITLHFCISGTPLARCLLVLLSQGGSLTCLYNPKELVDVKKLTMFTWNYLSWCLSVGSKSMVSSPQNCLIVMFFVGCCKYV